jgi:hypothetical protein
VECNSWNETVGMRLIFPSTLFCSLFCSLFYSAPSSISPLLFSPLFSTPGHRSVSTYRFDGLPVSSAATCIVDNTRSVAVARKRGKYSLEVLRVDRMSHTRTHRTTTASARVLGVRRTSPRSEVVGGTSLLYMLVVLVMELPVPTTL